MKHKKLQIAIMALAFLTLSGCDRVYYADYKITFVQPKGLDGDDFKLDEEKKLKLFLTDVLAKKGFERFTNHPFFWSSANGYVEIVRDHNGSLILMFDYLGGSRGVRLCQQTEREVVAILEKRRNLKLTPVPRRLKPLVKQGKELKK
jgi:hypothetical protein